MRVPSGRTEKRSAWALPVELSRLDLSLPAETTVTENISPRGARVVSRQQWQEGDRVFVKALKGDLRLRAQVVYCEILRGGLTAGRHGVTIVPESDVPSFKPQSSNSHGYGAHLPPRGVSSITLPPSAFHW